MAIAFDSETHDAQGRAVRTRDGDHPMTPGPVGGSAAWRMADMMRSDDWVFRLSDAEIAEIDEALARVTATGMPILAIGREDFALPTLGPRLDALRRELLEGRGFVLIRGVPVHRYDRREAATVYWGLGRYFGAARSQNGKGHVLGHVRDLGMDWRKDPNARIYQSTARQRFHTDSTDLVGLMCLQKSKSGGESSVSSSVAVHDEMWRRAPELLRELFQPFWRDRRGEVPEGKKPYYPMAVMHYHAGHLSTIYARDYIESAARFEEVPKLTERQVAALDLFDALVESDEFRLDMAFEPGDIQLLHNHQILHARNDFEDWPEPERKRHLLRLWLCPPDGRPLPPVFADRYGSIEIGDRGGIVVPGAQLNAPLEPV